jgi:hypothetical protein
MELNNVYFECISGNMFAKGSILINNTFRLYWAFELFAMEQTDDLSNSDRVRKQLCVW